MNQETGMTFTLSL